MRSISTKRDPRKIYLDANDLMKGSVALARQIYDSGFFYSSRDSSANEQGYLLNFLVGIWRGGTPVGIYVQELLKKKGIVMYHMPIKTESYTGVEQSGPVREVINLDYLVQRILVSRLSRALKGDDQRKENVLFADDVWDTGSSIKKIQEMMRQLFEDTIRDLSKSLSSYLVGKKFDYLPNMKTATVYYKPERNKTDMKPDFTVIETEAWIGFPHESNEFTRREIEENKDPIFAAALYAANFEKWAKTHLRLPK